MKRNRQLTALNANIQVRVTELFEGLHAILDDERLAKPLLQPDELQTRYHNLVARLKALISS